MRRTTSTRIFASITAVAALSFGAAACGSDGGSAGDSTTPTAASGSDVPVATAPSSTGSDTEATTGMVDEPGNPEVSVSSTTTGDSTVSTGSTGTSDSIDDPDTTVEGHTSDNLQEYIDSLAATTDNFDGLTTTPEETTCAAAAVLTPIGVEVLQDHEVTVENVEFQLDVLEFADPAAAMGIADGLVACGLGPRFAASFAESETAEDLDEAGQLELRACVEAALDDTSARSLLAGYLTPSTTDETYSPERTDAGEQMAGMVRDCGVKSRFYP